MKQLMTFKQVSTFTAVFNTRETPFSVAEVRQKLIRKMKLVSNMSKANYTSSKSYWKHGHSSFLLSACTLLCWTCAYSELEYIHKLSRKLHFSLKILTQNIYKCNWDEYHYRKNNYIKNEIKLPARYGFP